MSEKIIDVEAVPAKIVACPKCGQRNRLYRRKKRAAYRCGRCQTSLTNPFFLGKLAGFPLLRTLSILAGVAVAGLIVWGVIYFRSRETEPDPAGTVSPASTEPRTLVNGTILKGAGRLGFGTLAIDNGTETDAVVKLVNASTNGPPVTVVSFYVQKRQTTTVNDIPDGTFQVLFCTGTDWDSFLETFTRDDTYFEFEAPLEMGASHHKHTLAHNLVLNATSQVDAVCTNITKVDFMSE